MATLNPNQLRELCPQQGRLHLVVLALIGAIAMSPCLAYAQGMTIVPATCEPSANSLATPVFSFETNGSVDMAVGKTGYFTLRCNLPNISDYGWGEAWSYATVGFEDSSTSSLNYVTVTLHAVLLPTGQDYPVTLMDSRTVDATTGISTVKPDVYSTFYGGYWYYQYFLEITGFRLSGTSATEKIWYIKFE